MPAVAVAEALGADVVEVDARRTADGTAVLLHDATLGRLWGDRRRVAEVPWCEVARLGNGLDRIPRLEDVLERLDGSPTALVVAVRDVADAEVAARTVAATTSSTTVSWRGPTAATAIVRAVLPDADVWLRWADLAVPTRSDLVAVGPSTLDVDAAFLTADTVDAAHALGLAVAVRTLDEPEAVRWAARLGVDLIATQDVPGARAGCVPGPDPAREPGEVEVGARAQAVAHRLAHEVIAFTREHADEDARVLAGRIERLVRRRLRAAFPTHGCTGPVHGTASGDRHHWWVSAADGVDNAAAGVPWSSTSLFLTRNGRALVGVVADPWRGEVLEARSGHGAVLRDRALRLDDDPRQLAGAVVGTELDGRREWPGLVQLLRSLGERSCSLRVLGAGALTLGQVAAGRGIGACVPAFDPAVHGAAVLLVREAGGVVLGPTGVVEGVPRAGEPVLVAHPGAADELQGVWTAALAVG